MILLIVLYMTADSDMSCIKVIPVKNSENAIPHWEMFQSDLRVLTFFCI